MDRWGKKTEDDLRRWEEEIGALTTVTLLGLPIPFLRFHPKEIVKGTIKIWR